MWSQVCLTCDPAFSISYPPRHLPSLIPRTLVLSYNVFLMLHILPPPRTQTQCLTQIFSSPVLKTYPFRLHKSICYLSSQTILPTPPRCILSFQRLADLSHLPPTRPGRILYSTLWNFLLWIVRFPSCVPASQMIIILMNIPMNNRDKISGISPLPFFHFGIYLYIYTPCPWAAWKCHSCEDNRATR